MNSQLLNPGFFSGFFFLLLLNINVKDAFGHCISSCWQSTQMQCCVLSIAIQIAWFLTYPSFPEPAACLTVHKDASLKTILSVNICSLILNCQFITFCASCSSLCEVCLCCEEVTDALLWWDLGEAERKKQQLHGVYLHSNKLSLGPGDAQGITRCLCKWHPKEKYSKCLAPEDMHKQKIPSALRYQMFHCFRNILSVRNVNKG